jgi:hypothetical protein
MCSPKVFFCAARIMRSYFDKLNYDNIIDIVKTNCLRDAGREECTRFLAARTHYTFFRITVIPCFELQLSKGVDHLMQSPPTIFLRCFRNKPDHSISKKPTGLINAGRTADIVINPVVVLSTLFYWPTMNA